MAAGKGDGSSVAPVSGIVTSPKAFDRYKDALITEARLTSEDFDSQDISEAIGAKIMAAETLEEAVEAQEAGGLSGKDIVGFEHEVITFDMKVSTKENATRPVYYDVTAVALEDRKRMGLVTGEEFRYTVGAGNVVDIYYKARATDRFPLRVVLVEKATSSDNTVLIVRLLPKRPL